MWYTLHILATRTKGYGELGAFAFFAYAGFCLEPCIHLHRLPAGSLVLPQIQAVSFRPSVDKWRHVESQSDYIRVQPILPCELEVHGSSNVHLLIYRHCRAGWKQEVRLAVVNQNNLLA